MLEILRMSSRVDVFRGMLISIPVHKTNIGMDFAGIHRYKEVAYQTWMLLYTSHLVR